MKVIDIINVIEKAAPLEVMASWDVSGVQVASRRKEASHVAVMLDASLQNIIAAIEAGADFILSHHPLSMQPRYPNKADVYQDILTALITSGVWLYSAHTSLDSNPNGPVRWLGKALGLTDIRTLEPQGIRDLKVFAGTDAGVYGFGFIGNLPKPLAYAEFAEQLRSITGQRQWSACGAIPEIVQRIACCPGSGSDLVHLARAACADIFITGDVRYHFAVDAANQLPRVLDLGHFCLEEEMIRRFALQLADELSIPVTFYPSQDPLVIE